ncbi:MAG: hypothetical protein GY821_15840 [Gammaproteobacteria bacterium]|nr:hypothetical protein [Gammaproteobacteria bacterium]
MDELWICCSPGQYLMALFGIFQIGPINDEQRWSKFGLFEKSKFDKSLLFFTKPELPGFFCAKSPFNTYRIKKDRAKSMELEESYLAPKFAGQGPKTEFFSLATNF